MAYEKVKLVLAGLSGDIYMAQLNKDGTMSNNRRIATEDVLRATTEWFMKNNETGFKYKSIREGEEPHVFYTGNPDKAKRINEILNED